MITNKLTDTALTTKDFFYDLPKELIAQTPAEPRDSSRLLVLHKDTGETEHRIFRDIIDYLHEGDVLVINDSKVIPARLYGVKEDSGITVEVVLLRSRGLDVWETLVRPGRRCRPGTKIIFGDGLLRAEVLETVEGGNRLLKFAYEGDNIFHVLDKVGQMPLPPYITEKLKDKNRYQTVYAKEEGSAAAPTAGLHFTPELLERIKAKGVVIAPVMLHVGLGTFRPVKEDRIEEHEMHSEFISVSKETADLINNRKGRVFAVGTTSCRTLESASDENGIVHPVTDDTKIFIYPGYRFKITDALITNFHLPESTLLMLVSALTSREMMLKTYNEAIDMKYRFFSFGDAMLIL
ncbi:MAG: tRNA preQ1(34) S-adenosylmethionine ribosyltransferase-isomerase QueA [Firmicutes bacterium]|uniref:S-adenosylmethionine:tRNA ribosyltransferase-isomerase n=1 Tax=Candidatus Colimorpha enterica TaxID=3083063 RepID=A0AAE3FHH6_9BACT|nr:tRNA preQ1(34) S-adenosylmethionine ribosyltransferase-isomerase QueA [Candidatus Colimorpha enterica]MDD6321577.1 tRNA preQ1(34) S-adenosylmethionine ribosyltransferase-isomerase QueA [Bacillota bacterium]MDY2905877.1 tRNA preQ1(34) S-adenosylmethionine ribosyltransferase-isomerase QueA [Eubacteriales bacterium]